MSYECLSLFYLMFDIWRTGQPRVLASRRTSKTRWRTCLEVAINAMALGAMWPGAIAVAHLATEGCFAPTVKKNTMKRARKSARSVHLMLRFGHWQWQQQVARWFLLWRFGFGFSAPQPMTCFKRHHGTGRASLWNRP